MKDAELQDERGKVVRWYGTNTDIEERRQAEEAQKRTRDRIIRHQAATLTLAKAPFETLEGALRRITEVVAETLAVERVSIWTFNQDRTEIQCLDLFHLVERRHEQGVTLTVTQYPRYFAAMEESLTIAAEHARTDPRTSEFTEGYLNVLGISSMMDAPIRRGAMTLGVLCHEHVGAPREWTLDEQNFAGWIAELVSLAFETAERKRAERLLAVENQLLEMIAKDHSLSSILDALCRFVEETSAGSLCSILLLDSDGERLRHGAAPSLPASYTGAIDGSTIGPRAGSCGTAAYRKEPVIVSDIATDPLWADYRDLASTYGLRACWSAPILSSNASVLGTFAIYWREPRNPSLQQQSMIEQFSHLASIAIERKRAGEALRESEERWRAVFEHNPTMYFMVDAAGTVLSVNPFGAAQLGYTVNELVGHSVLNVFYEADRDAVQRNVAICLDHLGEAMSWEFRKVRKDGTVLWVRETAKAVLRGEDQPIILIVCEDITERKRAEEALRQDETELRRITDAIPHFISVLGPIGKVLYANQLVLEYSGLNVEDVMAEDFRARLFHPDDLERVRDERQNALECGAPFELELRARRKDGQYRWFLFRYNPLRDDEGRIIRWYATGTDIEDRKQAEERVQKENLALREEIDHSLMFEEIVGSSGPLRKVLAQVAKVASADTTVLILGETGTGKELIARAIHKRSNRSSLAFIRVNCAVIPPSLIASELFGHERGAFTGASQRRLGRFELADHGTIFLDEIGELPAETQIALLRVLQEREIERVGGSRPIPVDVRVLAATNRDLKAAMAAGMFRQDLFYRLSVFPIQIPSLRERVDDIPLLVEYLIERYAKKAGKKIRHIRKQSLELFQAYDWPGNIRELQNVIERAVVLCESETFFVDETWLKGEPRRQVGPAVPLAATIAEREREMIEAALAQSRGQVSGPTGAAAMLGLPRQTLESKIKSLGIDKHRFTGRPT